VCVSYSEIVSIYSPVAIGTPPPPRFVTQSPSTIPVGLCPPRGFLPAMLHGGGGEKCNSSPQWSLNASLSSLN
jgi:hypothetical protein